MRPRIRQFRGRDAEAVIDFSLRACAPVFASIEQALSSGIFGRLHPDWRVHQGRGIGTALTEFALDRLKDAGMRVAMVETGGDPGHAAARRT
jgi:hypothetical protein